MRDSVKRDYDWQLRFLPTIRRLVGPLLLVAAPLDLDMAEATDRLVLRARDLRIGCRVRRLGGRYAERYPWDFTIRSKRDTGATTELEKISNGWGDLLFYGHEVSQQSNDIERWFLIDLASWRSHLMRQKCHGEMISRTAMGRIFARGMCATSLIRRSVSGRRIRFRCKVSR